MPAGSSLALLKQLAADRLLFAPVMTFMFFFVTQLVKVGAAAVGGAWVGCRSLAALCCTTQTGDLGATLAFVRKVYPGALVKNYQFWTPAMIVNLRYGTQCPFARIGADTSGSHARGCGCTAVRVQGCTARVPPSVWKLCSYGVDSVLGSADVAQLKEAALGWGRKCGRLGARGTAA